MSRTFSCGCGVSIEEEGLEALIAPVLAHFDQAHPELGLHEISIRNYLEAEDRHTGPTEPVEALGEVEIRPVGPETVEDILSFFDHDAYVGYPAWGSCYCMHYACGGGGDPDGWSRRTGAENRAAQAELIGNGTTTGAVAYVDGRLAGFCNASRRSTFPDFATGDGDDTVGSVVCFAISPPYRGLGLSGMLLDGVIERLGELGMRRVEAYPRPHPTRWELSYRGTLDLYLGHGFEVASDDPLVVSRPT